MTLFIHCLFWKKQNIGAFQQTVVRVYYILNSANRNTFLHNVKIIWPSITRYVKNCYSLRNRLFIIGGGEIQSIEGAAQGDPVAMSIYAIAIIPMIFMLVEISLQGNYNTFTAVYADGLTAARPIDQLKKW